MADKVINGAFVIALVAMIAINWRGVASFIQTSGQTYATTVAGLQGR